MDLQDVQQADIVADNHVYDSSVEFIPSCLSPNKPYVGRKFLSLKEAEEFYRSYGAECGFDVRLGQIKRATDGTVLWRYMYCNREGVEAPSIVPSGLTMPKRKRRSDTRVSCKARVVFQFCGHEGYSVNVFHEGHTHEFVSDNHKHFLKSNRNLDDVRQNFILNCAKANIGPMRSFRLFKEIVGSYRDVGCTGLEFKNFSRDLNAFVDGVDAQILLDKFKNKQEIFPDFSYDYSVDEDGKLTRLFWADHISKKMYRIFGEAVSFDATYSSNKYNMVFTPFTGKDNHGRCVTFAPGLLSREDVDAYTWILDKFLECMKKKPSMIITDQDPALKIAIEKVMPDTNHRFCMWHIMLKVADKIPVSLRDDEMFAKRFNGIVWSEYIEPEVFDLEWRNIVETYGLVDNEWFNTMFDLRQFWIPAFFRDIHMGGLFRTTSISESENSFFRRYNNKNDNLLSFLMHFDSAIDAQRNQQEKLSSKDESTFPIMRTDCLFEKHAGLVYTSNIFERLQKEMKFSGQSCSIANIRSGEKTSTYDIRDSFLMKSFMVFVNVEEMSFECECKNFLKHGLLCRHIFVVFRNLRVHKIPEKYILSRWTKHAVSVDLPDNTSNTDSRQNEVIDMLSKLHISAKRCIGVVQGIPEKMKEMLQDLDELFAKYKNDGGDCTDYSGKKQLLETFYGCTVPDQIYVLPPDPVKTKGSGSRLKSRKEKAIRDANKPLRKCSKCKQMAKHDARNCDNVG